MAVLRTLSRAATRNYPSTSSKSKKDKYIIRIMNSPRNEVPQQFSIMFEADSPEEALRMAQELYGGNRHNNKLLIYQVDRHTNRR